MSFVCIVAGGQLEITDLMTKVKSEYMPNVKTQAIIVIELYE